MKIDVQDSFGKVVESIKLDSKIFSIEVLIFQKIDLLLEVVVRSLGNKKVGVSPERGL